MSLGTMYPGIVNSPELTLAVAIEAGSVDITVNGDVAELPAAPNIFVLGTGEDAETVYYPTDAVSNVFYGVTRAFQGTAVSWVAGTPIARLFTAYDYDTLRTNITELNSDKISKTIFTAKGDLITSTAASTPSILAVGTDGQVLTSGSDGSISWTSIVGSVTEVTGTAPIVSSGGNQPEISIDEATVSVKGAMSAADKTKLDGIEEAADVTDATNVAAAGAIMDTTYATKGDIIVADDDETPVALAVGTDGQVLTAQADGTVAWEDPTTEGGAVASISAGDSSITIVGTTTPTIAVSTAGVTLAKMADLAQDTLIGRSTASTGVPEVITCTAAGRALLDDASASAQRTTLGISVTGTLPITVTATTTPVVAINAATTSTAGSMSAADKTKLDSLNSAFDVIVYRSGSTVYAVSKAGTTLSSGSYSTSNVQIQAALDYLDGLSITNNTIYPYGYTLYIAAGQYTMAAPVYTRCAHQITGAGKNNTRLIASSSFPAGLPLVSINCSAEFTSETGTDTDTVVCSTLPTTIAGVTVPDNYYNDGYIFNITRGEQGIISGYVASTKTVSISATDPIAGQVSGDVFRISKKLGGGIRGACFRDMRFDGNAVAEYGTWYAPQDFINFSITQTLFENCMWRQFTKHGALENSNWGPTYFHCGFDYNGYAHDTTLATHTSVTPSPSTLNRYVKADDLVATDHYYNGWYCWNLTTNTGRIVGEYVGSTKTMDFDNEHWDHFGETTWTVGDQFILVPPWGGMLISGTNVVNLIGCNFDESDNGVVITASTGTNLRSCIIENISFTGITVYKSTKSGFTNGPRSVLIDGCYYEGCGVYNSVRSTTIGFHDNFVACKKCIYVTLSSCFCSDNSTPYLTPARHSSSLLSYGDYTNAIAYQAHLAVHTDIEGVGHGVDPAETHQLKGEASTFFWERNGVTSTTVSDGGTITHGLACTPTWAVVTGSNATTGDNIFVTSMSATTLTIAIKKLQLTYSEGAADTISYVAGTPQVLYWRCGIT